MNPKRHQARSIEWDPYSSGHSSWRAAHLLHTDAEYMAAADQPSYAHKTLDPQEPSIHGFKSGEYGGRNQSLAPTALIA